MRALLQRPLAAPLMALLLRLHMPAIQLVNYLLMPLQPLLIIPLLRFDEHLVGAPPYPVTLGAAQALLSQGAIHAIQILATTIAHATIAWLLVASLLAIVLYRGLESVLRHLRLAGLPHSQAWPARSCGVTLTAAGGWYRITFLRSAEKRYSAMS